MGCFWAEQQLINYLHFIAIYILPTNITMFKKRDLQNSILRNVIEWNVQFADLLTEP